MVNIIKAFTEKSPDSVDRTALRRAAHSLAELSKSGTASYTILYPTVSCCLCTNMFCPAEENVDTVVSEGAIRHVVPLLTFFPPPTADSKDRRYTPEKAVLCQQCCL